MIQLKFWVFPLLPSSTIMAWEQLMNLISSLAKTTDYAKFEGGGHQAIEPWLLIVVLSNCYQIFKRSNIPFPRELDLTSCQDFRRHLGHPHLARGEQNYDSPAKQIAHIHPEADQKRLRYHNRIRMGNTTWCKAGQGDPFSDRPQKTSCIRRNW